MAARARSRFDRDDDTAPRSDVYTGLLALSFIAMIVSCLLLFLDYSQYGTTKAPSVTMPQPRVREGVQTGQLPPLLLPPPAPVGARPTAPVARDDTRTAAAPVKPAGGEEASAPVAPAPKLPEPPPPPAPAAEPPMTTPTVPTPEPVAVPPVPEPAAKPAAPAATAPAPPPLPKSIRSLPN